MIRRKPKTSKPKARLVQLGEALDSMVDKKLSRSSLEFSAYVRTLVAADLGKPELANLVRRGRPRKSTKGRRPAR